jgi:hypothetical protein
MVRSVPEAVLKATKGVPDPVRRCIEVKLDVTVMQPQQAVPLPAEERFFALVLQPPTLLVVIGAVDFYGQSQLRAGKVDNNIANHKLSSESISVELTPSQPAPEETLGPGRVVPQLSGSFGNSHGLSFHVCSLPVIQVGSENRAIILGTSFGCG